MNRRTTSTTGSPTSRMATGIEPSSSAAASSPVASLAIAGTGQYAAIRSGPLDRSALAAAAGVDFRIGKNAALGVGYSGVIGKNNSDHGVKATLSVGF